MLHPEKFVQLGIDPPTGVLMYGPPGTGEAHPCTVDVIVCSMVYAGPLSDIVLPACTCADAA